MVFYFCDICNFETENKALYKRHCKTNKHDKLCKIADELDICCKRCNIKFISEEQLDNHTKRNKLFIEMPYMQHRKCNDFVCIQCNIGCRSCDDLITHQSKCSGISKYANNLKVETQKKRINCLEKQKQFILETEGNGLTTNIEKIKEKVAFLGDDYPEDDYYHDYDFVNVDDWQIQYPDDDSMFFDKIMNVRNKIQYREKNYIIDGKLNAYDADDLCIGGFVEA